MAGGKGRGLEEPDLSLSCSRSFCIARDEPHGLPHRKAACPTDSVKGKFLTQVLANFSLLSWSPIALPAVTLEDLLQACPTLKTSEIKVMRRRIS